MLGSFASIFFIQSSVEATENDFYHLGTLAGTNYSNTEAIEDNEGLVELPESLIYNYPWYSYNGIFKLNGPNEVTSAFYQPIFSLFSKNTYDQVFCFSACIYKTKYTEQMHPMMI